MLTLSPKHASGSLRSWAARAFSGEVGTGSPQKMRPLKDNQSECRFDWNEMRSRGQQMPACKAGALPSAPAIAFGTGRPRFIRLIGFPPMHYLESWKQSAYSDTERGQRASDGYPRGEPAIKLLD
jgi:hypothetical protein